MNYKQLTSLPNAYSAVMFIKHPAAGTVICLTTLWQPNIGLAGLLATITGLSVLRLFQFPDDAIQAHSLNSLLVGLSLGAFFELNIYLVVLIIMCAALVTFLSITLADSFWRLGQVPVLSLPFVMVALFASLIANNTEKLTHHFSLNTQTEHLFTPWIDTFFSAIGTTFFTPNPLIGFAIFICILLYSRYLAFLTISGYIVGFSTFIFFVDNPQPYLIAWSGFNFMLTAIALGGIYTVPSIVSFGYAMLGASLAALLCVAIQNFLLLYGLPVMAIPFVIITLTLLIAMRKQSRSSSLCLATEPGQPELNYERTRLARIRQGGLNSVPLLTPFYGSWRVYQGFNGPHTHKVPWQHALDFFMLENGKSFSGNAIRLEDFYCYNAPITSPVYGIVVRIVNNITDNPPGEIDTKNNWGNLVLIRLETGQHVLLAHLKFNSIQVTEGEWIKPGLLIGNCGNSGRSPQPHLHLQVQQDATLGSQQYRYLCSVIVNKNELEAEYKVVSQPQEQDCIEAAELDKHLSTRLHFPVGRTLSYEMQSTDTNKKTAYHLYVEVTLNGQFRIHSNSGASVAITEANGVLALYDRNGPADIFINLWTLCLGLTPLTERAKQWDDAPSSALLPLSWSQRLWLTLLQPLGNGLNSRYHRQWSSKTNTWLQEGNHVLSIGTKKTTAKTTATISPEDGCTELTLSFAGKEWRAYLTETGLSEDQGIPKWNQKQNEL